MTSFTYDQQYLQSALDELETYLFSDQVFWPIGVEAPAGQPGYPKLTAANLLLAFTRLAHNANTPAQKATARQLSDRFNALTAHWQSHWQDKLQQEYTSRLRQWSSYLQELDEAPEKYAAYYPTEVRLRLLLDLLAVHSQVDLAKIKSLDNLLKQYFILGDFVWEPDSIEIFPQDEYWYLYGSINDQHGVSRNLNSG